MGFGEMGLYEWLVVSGVWFGAICLYRILDIQDDALAILTHRVTPAVEKIKDQTRRNIS